VKSISLAAKKQLARLKGRASGPSARPAAAARPGRWAAVALGLLVVTLCLINAVWIARDTRPQPGPDPNTYLIETYEFLDKLKEAGRAVHRSLRAGALHPGDEVRLPRENVDIMRVGVHRHPRQLQRD
jgi:hypothetical protein